MSLMNLRKNEAINAVKNENLLIADVAKQFGFTTRQVYQWLQSDRNKNSFGQYQSSEKKINLPY